MPRQRTIALCDESAAKQFAPWSQDCEDRAFTAWQAVERLNPADAAQETAMIDAMIERLEWLKEGGNA